MSLTANAIMYLQEQFPNASFIKDIILRDDGNGPYIYYWGIGSPKPSEEEINIAAQSMIIKQPFPSIEERLDMIYNDMKNGTKTYVEAIDQWK